MKADPACLAAVERARAAAVEEAGSEAAVGEPVGHVAEGDRLLTHLFDCRLPGYVGWRWAVTLTRAPRARTVTINDVVLIAGEDALAPPEWVPWSQRLEPSDLGPGAVLPTDADDPRLIAGYESVERTAERLDVPPEAAADIVLDLGLARARLLSVAGQDEAAGRWHAADSGPDAPIALAASQHCRTCGFMVPLTGRLGTAFAVCSNGLAPDDGRVVSLDHGCGGHSEVSLPVSRSVRPSEVVYDSGFDLIF